MNSDFFCSKGSLVFEEIWLLLVINKSQG